ncbi:MAG: hypothetical protein ABR520_11165 [Mycobacteriales bacterium]|nr:hypothetical protein [Actinomycetota bacterium]
MKLDLDEIEREHREQADEGHSYYPHCGPEVVLALVAIARAAERFVDQQGKRVLDRELMGTADFEGDLFVELVKALEAAGR